MAGRDGRSDKQRHRQLLALLIVVATVLTTVGCTSESDPESVEPVSTSIEPAEGSGERDVPPLDDATSDLVAVGLSSNDPEVISEVLWPVDEATVNDIASNAVPEGMQIVIDTEGFAVDDEGLGSSAALLTGSDGVLWDVVFWFRWDADTRRWRVIGTTEPVKR